MHIGIDGHCIGDMSGGNETYWRNLVRELANIDHKNKYTVFFNKNTDFKFDNTNFEKKEYFVENTLWRNLISIPYNTKIERLDLVHTQYFKPMIKKNKAIVTIHDISFEHYPECFTKKQLFINKQLIRAAAEKSKYILTVSKFSKDDIVNKYDIDPDKIFVTYLAANPIFKPIENAEKIKNILKKYNINDKFILAVGNLQPRKNLGRLIEAFKNIKKMKQFQNFKLVLVGKKNWKDDGMINGVDISEISSEIIFTGYIVDEDLPYLYNGCEVFVYPSIFEGFGLPPLEAMNCGTVVLASNISSIPEVIGSGGISINPLDVKDIINELVEALANKQLRQYYKEESIKQAKLFTWKNTAVETIKVYEKIME